MPRNDAYQRVTYIQYGGGPNVTPTYDNGTNGYGHLTEVQWGGSTNCPGYSAYTEFYTYTTAGQVQAKDLWVTKNLSGGSCAIMQLNGSYVYDTEGKVVQVGYPAGTGSPAILSYSYDSMSRLIGASDAETLGTPNGCSGPPTWSGAANWASNATYNAAGQLLGMERPQSITATCTAATPLYFNQAWSYNNLNQMTGILTSTQGTNGFPVGSVSPGTALSNFVTYNFSATQNNGQIMSMVDARQGGNTVSYTYDSLKRLTNAQTTAWTQAITYDGFSNIATKQVPTGSAEPTFPGVNSANNQLTGATYDANGNMTAMPSGGPALAYDYENRAKSATMGSFVESYAYDESNRRVEKINSGNDFIYFYGGDGRLLSTFKATVSGSSYSLALVSNRVYFGGVLIGQAGLTAQLDASTLQDRLGTSNAGYPYGTDQAGPPTTDDALDFASYSRDVNSGLEYAMNRYYSTGYGRFLTVDRFGGSARAGNPTSWNRYSYSLADPINGHDPSGLCSSGSGGDDYVGSCYCPPEQQYCDQGPPGTDYGINDPSQGNCGTTTGFVDGDTDDNVGTPETVGEGTGCQPPPPPPQQPVECEADLFTRPVQDWRAHLLHAVHSYWEVQEIFANGFDLDEMISSGPFNNTGTLGVWVHLPSEGPDTVAAGKWRWGTGPSLNHGFSPTNCAGTSLMLQTALYWQSLNGLGDIPYNATKGLNSNSFASFIGAIGGFYPPQPWGAYGWGYPL